MHQESGAQTKTIAWNFLCLTTGWGPGVTANLFRSANLFRRNLFASGSVPDFQKISEFVPMGNGRCFFDTGATRVKIHVPV